MIIIIIVISVGVLKNSAWSPEPHFVSSLGMSRNTFISEKSPSALLPAPPSSTSPSFLLLSHYRSGSVRWGIPC